MYAWPRRTNNNGRQSPPHLPPCTCVLAGFLSIRRKLGDELVETYAGPDLGVATIKAEEWQPFIRTMPHSEYPSASSCICEVSADNWCLVRTSEMCLDDGGDAVRIFCGRWVLNNTCRAPGETR